MSNQSNTYEFETREFVVSHGREPRGRGSWAFRPAGTAQDDWDAVVFSPSMTYTEARRWVKANYPAGVWMVMS